MVVALVHAAVGNLFQQLTPGLLRQNLRVLGHSHLLCHLLSDGHILLQAQLQSLMILQECQITQEYVNVG